MKICSGRLLLNKYIKILLIAFSLLNIGNVYAEAQLNGYLSSQFGMSADEVRSAIKDDGIVFSSSETTDGDHLIFATREQSWITTDILYVFPAGSDRLALIIEIYPGMVDSDPIRKEVSEKLGQPSSDNYPESVLGQMQESNLIPSGVSELAVWNITSDGIDREARVMGLEKYVRVEYIDNDLMAGK